MLPLWQTSGALSAAPEPAEPAWPVHLWVYTSQSVRLSQHTWLSPLTSCTSYEHLDVCLVLYRATFSRLVHWELFRPVHSCVGFALVHVVLEGDPLVVPGLGGPPSIASHAGLSIHASPAIQLELEQHCQLQGGYVRAPARRRACTRCLHIH
jgi:hypothetical protein